MGYWYVYNELCVHTVNPLLSPPPPSQISPTPSNKPLISVEKSFNQSGL